MPSPQVSYEPIRDIFAAMQTEQINGVPLSDVIGGGAPEVIASEILGAMTNYVDLKLPRSVLDVGCGCGRIAAGLTQHLAPGSRYVGVDIVPGLVEFGKKFISSRYPNFTFLLLDQGNVTYNAMRLKGGRTDIAKLSQAQSAGTVDLAISISLFTHLDYAQALDILTAISHTLAKGGQAFVTVFVVDAEAGAGIGSNRTGFSFRHRTPSGKLRAEKLEEPTYAVGYEVEQIGELARSAGLELERWVRGYWSHGGPGETFQDALVLRKR